MRFEMIQVISRNPLSLLEPVAMELVIRPESEPFEKELSKKFAHRKWREEAIR